MAQQTLISHRFVATFYGIVEVPVHLDLLFEVHWPDKGGCVRFPYPQELAFIISDPKAPQPHQAAALGSSSDSMGNTSLCFLQLEGPIVVPNGLGDLECCPYRPCIVSQLCCSELRRNIKLGGP